MNNFRSSFLKIATQPCSEVQKYESVQLFESVISNNAEGVDIILDFLGKNYQGMYD